MAVIPSFRVNIFTLITLVALVVLGICAHLEFLLSGYIDASTSFVPFGIGAAGLTIVSLPLFLVLGNLRRPVFTSTILFEVVWFFLLWILWVASAGDTVVGKASHFPYGCVYDNYPKVNQICHEITVVEILAFVNFFCAFIYYDVIFLYAIINAIRGRSIWTTSVKEAATGDPGTVKPGVPMAQPQFNVAPGGPYQNYGGYPTNAPPPQPGPYNPYNPYFQQVPAQPYLSQYSPQGSPPQPYPQQVPQTPPPQQYNAYLQQAPQSDLNQPYNYSPSPSPPQQQANYPGYSPSSPSSSTPLPPHPNYNARPISSSQAQLPSLYGYQGPLIPAEPLPSPYSVDGHT